MDTTNDDEIYNPIQELVESEGPHRDLDDMFSPRPDRKVSLKKKKKKKKGKQPVYQTVEVLKPTARQKQMANAFGGTPFGDVKRDGIRYDKDRLADARRIPLRSTIERPMTRTEFERLSAEVAGMNKTPKPMIAKSMRAAPSTK